MIRMNRDFESETKLFVTDAFARFRRVLGMLRRAPRVDSRDGRDRQRPRGDRGRTSHGAFDDRRGPRSFLRGPASASIWKPMGSMETTILPKEQPGSDLSTLKKPISPSRSTI